MYNYQELKEKSLLPTNDVIFHCLFGTIGNEGITKDFIEKILNKEVSEITLDLNLNLIREHFDSKLGILDVRAKTKEGINYNIEMQNSSSATLPERILSYWSRLYTGDLKKGNNYDVLAKTIAILIVNDEIDRFNFIEKYHTKWNIREEDYKDVILTDDFEIHVIELPKYLEMRNNNFKNIWLDFLINPVGKEVLTAMKENKKLKDAGNKLDEITSDEVIRDRALRLEIAELDRNTDLKHAREAGISEGIQQGIQQGIEQGAYQEIKKIVLLMHEQKIPLDQICKLTELDLEEVKKIISNK